MAWIDGSDPRIRLNVWASSNNTSYVTLTVQVETKTPCRATVQAGSRMYVNGTQYDIPAQSSCPGISSGESIYTKTGITVYYGSATTLSIPISASITYYFDDGQGMVKSVSSFSGSFSVTRPASPQPMITTSASSVTLGTSVNITTTNGSASAMTVKCGDYSATIASSVGNTTTSWTPNLNAIAPYITNGKSATATISWKGASKNITLVVPDNANTKPTCSVALAVSNGLSGAYVQNKSKVVATVSATAKLSATINNVSIVVNGQTLTPSVSPAGTISVSATSSLLVTTGQNTCNVTVTDSRGISNTCSGTFTVVAYTNPSVTSVNIYRSNASKTADTNGTYITYKFTPVVANISGITKQYRLKYRLANTTSWTYATDWTTISTTGEISQAIGGSLSTTSVYEAQVELKDSYETTYSSIFTIPTSSVIMDFNSAGTGGGIGMYTQNSDVLDVNWKLRPNKGIISLAKTFGTNGLTLMPWLTYGNMGIASNIGTEAFLKAWLKKVCELYPNNNEHAKNLFVGVAQPNSIVFIFVYIYNTSLLDSDGLPQYCFGQMTTLNNSEPIVYFQTSNYTFSYKNVGGPAAIDQEVTKSIGTSYTYTGVSVTVPANRFFTFTYWAYYSTAAPAGIVLSDSSTSLDVRQESVTGSAGNARVSATYSGKSGNSAKTYYVWAKAASSGNIGIEVSGYYM